ncbi:hypothetical protein CBR_g30632 [Chara braunii]|uniref:ATP-dependent Clp protease proteolytic subunit n=1 Tax=Chara braunii TaxID=69332 RepID=A0A388LD86_CHABU|nr:hypothetical protein CBR_g30632 [Chara braunii]|eukprot:GBG80266.1 hypothetical protein CBR_g30632 [Chara braunii]
MAVTSSSARLLCASVRLGGATPLSGASGLRKESTKEVGASRCGARDGARGVVRAWSWTTSIAAVGSGSSRLRGGNLCTAERDAVSCSKSMYWERSPTWPKVKRGLGGRVWLVSREELGREGEGEVVGDVNRGVSREKLGRERRWRVLPSCRRLHRRGHVMSAMMWPKLKGGWGGHGWVVSEEEEGVVGGVNRRGSGQEAGRGRRRGCLLSRRRNRHRGRVVSGAMVGRWQEGEEEGQRERCETERGRSFGKAKGAEEEKRQVVMRSSRGGRVGAVTGSSRRRGEEMVITAKRGAPAIAPLVLSPAGIMDINTVLLQNRIVFVGSPVDSRVAQRVISQLMTLAAIDEKKDIKMYINSPGGSIYSILAVYDCMSFIKPDVSTICMGIAASQSALLLAGGTKGKRFAMPNARIMIHQPQGGCGGTIADVRRQASEVMISRDKIDKMYHAFTGQSLERIQMYTDRDRFFSAPEAMEFGLIDDVLLTEY